MAEPWQPGQSALTFRKILVLPICQSSCVPSTASAMRWHVPRRSPWVEDKDTGSITNRKAPKCPSQDWGSCLSLPGYVTDPA